MKTDGVGDQTMVLRWLCIQIAANDKEFGPFQVLIGINWVDRNTCH